MRTSYRKILVAAALSALASMAILASAANAAPPAPPYQDFAGCPSQAEQPFVATCAKVTFTGGHISIGNRTVPVTNPIVLRGGIEQITERFISNSEGGIVPVRQTVPGGLIGMTGRTQLAKEFSSKFLTLYAVVESAGQPGVFGETNFTLPVKIHLENPLLGNSCYVGSSATPINLDLTTGTTAPPAPNKPITGELAGGLEPETGREAVVTTTVPGKYVDNAYSVPGATGCQLNLGKNSIAINNLVNAAYHLPAAAGTNEAVLNYGFSFVLPEVAYPTN
jgi:hypothetical protein